MSDRRWSWAAGLGLIGAGDLALAIHSRVGWHASADGPRVMTLGQLLGFVSAITLLVITTLLLVSATLASRRRRRFARATESLRQSRNWEPGS